VVVHLSTAYIIFSTEKFVALVALPLSTPLHLLNGLERLQHVEASRKRTGLVKGKPDLVTLDYCSCIHEQDNTHMSGTQRLRSNPVRSNAANQACHNVRFDLLQQVSLAGPWRCVCAHRARRISRDVSVQLLI
jgi:hypothetical protein